MNFKSKAMQFLGPKTAEPQSTYDLRVRYLADVIQQAYNEGYEKGKKSGAELAYYQCESDNKGYEIG